MAYNRPYQRAHPSAITGSTRHSSCSGVAVRGIGEHPRVQIRTTAVLGYPAMNHTLRAHDPVRRCSHDMRRQTWESNGLPYAGELAAQNSADIRRYSSGISITVSGSTAVAPRSCRGTRSSTPLTSRTSSGSARWPASVGRSSQPTVCVSPSTRATGVHSPVNPGTPSPVPSNRSHTTAGGWT